MWESWGQEQDKDKQQYQQEKGGAQRERGVQGCTMDGGEVARKTREKRDGKRREKKKKKNINNQNCRKNLVT